jgi:CheY-like chemotaxis protein
LELPGRRVLVVDDEELVRFTHTELLQDLGCTVIEAVDGREALAMLRFGVSVDLLLTDVRMPVLDGWTLAERARELQPDLPVIYTTGDLASAARPVPDGIVLEKPFRRAELIIALGVLLRDAPLGGATQTATAADGRLDLRRE